MTQLQFHKATPAVFYAFNNQTANANNTPYPSLRSVLPPQAGAGLYLRQTKAARADKHV